MQMLYPRLSRILLDRLQQDPEQPVIIWHESVVTAADCVRSVVWLSRVLWEDLGVRKGERVVVVAFNRPETLLLLFAAARIQCILVLVNARYSPSEVVTVLNDSAPRVIFHDDITEQLVKAAAAQYSSAIKVVNLSDIISERSCLPSLEEAVEELKQPDVDPNQPVLMLYTSGTTGALKGVLLTELNLLANITQVSSVVEIPDGTEALIVTPLFHAAILPAALVPLAKGSTLVMCEKFNAQRALELLESRPVTWTVMVPTMIQACLDQLGGNQLRRPRYPCFIYYGASPAPRALIEEAMQYLRVQLIQSYGLTEATQAVTVLSPEDHVRGLSVAPELLRSAGRALPHTEIAIWSTDAQPLAPGIVGEIVVRGPQVMSGYWNRPDETATVLVNGWLRTGDVGYIDEKGYLFVTDRIKDIVISGGENVFSSRVEDVIRMHPAVREVAVIGLPNHIWGETVHAVIALRPGYSPTSELAAEIIQHCRQELAGFEIPRSVEFVPELPRSATGKILKRTLRERPLGSFALALDLRDTARSPEKRDAEVS